ncbi:hypothetical protein Egran_04572 [Elaphomyces granulatus]|uniref:Uncharacterized protein n=1 Tax=Elaphomyces granulatus TaxID=519963 RepID=A0A232LU67_9EURO|nr:hypothetical protein Egran_04572 [Elaphomyces granulatus]
MEDGDGHTGPNGARTSGRSRSDSASSGHKRSLSGTLLSKLSFLRMSQMTEVAVGFQAGKYNAEFSSNQRGGRAMATVRKMRRRRGSLRKAALLGTRFESKEKKGPSARSQNLSDGESHGYIADDNNNTSERSPVSPTSPDSDLSTPRSSIDSTSSVYLPLITQPLPPANISSSHREPDLDPTSPNYETTTDDEDGVVLPRLNNIALRNSSGGSSAATGVHIPTPSSSSDSYFPLQPDSLPRQVRTTHRAKSPLATHPVEINSQESWDYSETEWWGWIILIVTWLVFVIGMGSCFEVWSWAWDVGETPYAPPELEDDPTLPIVGYYPALMVLTAVMAWVWVVVAWVGMKYFKHANITGDDG